jgi:putative ABC transport system ATP-binding protein
MSLTITNGVVTYGGAAQRVNAMQNLVLDVPAGQFVTIVGTNGAGKSTLVGVISGAVRLTRGSVHIAGRDVTRLPEYRRAGAVARVFDNPHAGTCAELSIEDNLALAMSRGRPRRLVFALTERRRTRMREALSTLGLGLENLLSTRVALLSAGQRQSLTMVMASLAAPQVLLLDEHLAALDPGTASKVLALTRQIATDMGCTALMVTHNMDHAVSIGDRLLVLSRGQVIGDFSGQAKRELTVKALIDTITGAGDTVSDRILLEQRAPAGQAASADRRG